MSMNLVTLLYLVASVCFIQALKGLSGFGCLTQMCTDQDL